MSRKKYQNKNESQICAKDRWIEPSESERERKRKI